MNVTLQVVTGMGEWVQVGNLKCLPGKQKNMGNETDNVLEAGLEVALAA